MRDPFARVRPADPAADRPDGALDGADADRARLPEVRTAAAIFLVVDLVPAALLVAAFVAVDLVDFAVVDFAGEALRPVLLLAVLLLAVLLVAVLLAAFVAVDFDGAAVFFAGADFARVFLAAVVVLDALLAGAALAVVDAVFFAAVPVALVDLAGVADFVDRVGIADLVVVDLVVVDRFAAVVFVAAAVFAVPLALAVFAGAAFVALVVFVAALAGLALAAIDFAAEVALPTAFFAVVTALLAAAFAVPVPLDFVVLFFTGSTCPTLALALRICETRVAAAALLVAVGVPAAADLARPVVAAARPAVDLAALTFLAVLGFAGVVAPAPFAAVDLAAPAPRAAPVDFAVVGAAARLAAGFVVACFATAIVFSPSSELFIAIWIVAVADAPPVGFSARLPNGRLRCPKPRYAPARDRVPAPPRWPS